MKIAVFHELKSGGAKKAAIELALQLQKHHQVEFIYVAENIDESLPKKLVKTTFFQFSARHWRGGDWKTRLYKDTLELVRRNWFHKNVARYIDQQHVDLVLVHPSQFTQAPFVLRHLKTPTWYYCPEPLRMIYDPLCNRIDEKLPIFHALYEKVLRFVRKQIDRKNILAASHVLCNSKYTKECIKRSYGIDAQVCYLGVDTHIFRPQAAKKSIDILYIGEETFVEGYDLVEKLMKKFAKTTRWTLLLGNVDATGLADAQLADIYAKSRVVLAVGRGEPFGLIPLEAMACGVPIVALNQGGYKESIIHEKTGLLVEPNEHKLYSAINKLLRNTKKAEELGKYSISYVLKQWTWEQSGERLERLIEQKEG